MAQAIQPSDEVIVVAGKRFVSHDRAAFLFGLRPPSFASALSRGRLALTRYQHGRGRMYDLDEIEQLILKRAVPAGRRVR